MSYRLAECQQFLWGEIIHRAAFASWNSFGAAPRGAWAGQKPRSAAELRVSFGWWFPWPWGTPRSLDGFWENPKQTWMMTRGNPQVKHL